jgi:hypothetical protein
LRAQQRLNAFEHEGFGSQNPVTPGEHEAAPAGQKQRKPGMQLFGLPSRHPAVAQAPQLVVIIAPLVLVGSRMRRGPQLWQK